MRFKNADEYGFGRPIVYRQGSYYHMLTSVRSFSKGYRIGYAVSRNGIQWTRRDGESGIDVSKNGWDSEMVCFPSLFSHRDRTFLFYNGNGFGRTGFGIAERVS